MILASLSPIHELKKKQWGSRSSLNDGHIHSFVIPKEQRSEMLRFEPSKDESQSRAWLEISDLYESTRWSLAAGSRPPSGHALFPRPCPSPRRSGDGELAGYTQTNTGVSRFPRSQTRAFGHTDRWVLNSSLRDLGGDRELPFLTFLLISTVWGKIN